MKKSNLIMALSLMLSAMLWTSCNKEAYIDNQEQNQDEDVEVFSRSSNYVTIKVHHLNVREGSWEEAPLSKINRKDQYGSNDAWSKYIELSPNSRRFRGYFSYYLPDGVDRNRIESVKVKVNYKGEKYRNQRWYWKIKNYNNNSWENLGNNSFAQEWRWSYKNWTKNSNKYVRERDGQILIKLYSNDDTDVCDIDYMVVQVKLRSDNNNSWWQASPELSFDWILGEDNLPPVSSIDAEVVDVDGFETSASYVSQLHNAGKKAIAYISVGSWENWRPDADRFPDSVKKHNYDGWAGEKFLDIRQIDVLRPIMHDRFVMAKNKGFDAIEPDNIDLHSYTSGEIGYHCTEQDVINYCQMLTEEAHALGLSIGQKNAADLSSQMVNLFDWILLEDAYYEYYRQGEHDAVNDSQIYINHNKAVFATEYTDNMSRSYFDSHVCPKAQQLHHTAILKDRDLMAPIHICD